MLPNDPRHGTPNGYNAHRAAGQRACRPCLDAHNDYNKANDDVALTGGQWVRRPRSGGVLEWVPTPAIPLAQIPTERGPIVCACGARATESCRTANGHRTKAHSYRGSPQVCPCGQALSHKCRVCSDCRDLLDRDRKNAWKVNARGGLGITHRSPHSSLIAGTIGGEGTDKQSTPERRANAMCSGASPTSNEGTD